MSEIVLDLSAEHDVVVFEGAILEFEPPKKVVDKEALDSATEVIALWGTSNDLPQLIMTEIKRNSDLGSLLHLQARALYSGGVGYRIKDATTGEVLEKRKKEIDLFLKRNWMYPIQACEDFYKFYNFFPEFKRTDQGDKIKWLTARPANFCRLGLQNDSGNIDYTYVNANWPNVQADDKTTLKVPTISAIYADVEELKNSKHQSVMFGMCYPTGETYYSLPNWWSLKMSKWLELANKIPAFKLALMNNQLTIKYHIQIPDTHWEFIEPKWKNLKAEDKKAIKKEEIDKISKMLTGVEKAGKTLTTGYHYDRNLGKEFPGIKITAIDDKLKDGMYLEDSVEATIKLFTALGLDPAILGIVPGKGGSNRSGSDKREAIMMYTQLIQPHADMVLRPYVFAAEYNKWEDENEVIEFYFKSAAQLQTLDKVTPKDRENINPKSEEDAAA